MDSTVYTEKENCLHQNKFFEKKERKEERIDYLRKQKHENESVSVYLNLV